MLTFYGIDIPNELKNSHRSKRFINWLDSIDNQALSALLMELNHLDQTDMFFVKAGTKFITGEDTLFCSGYKHIEYNGCAN
jgi:hypothetical protein